VARLNYTRVTLRRKILPSHRLIVALSPRNDDNAHRAGLDCLQYCNPTQKHLACPVFTVRNLFSIVSPPALTHTLLSLASRLPHLEPSRSHGRVHLRQLIHDKSPRASLHSSPCLPCCFGVLERRRDVQQHLQLHQSWLWFPPA
jgi:hypothetical protein